MKIFPTQKIYDSFQLKVNKSQSEILDLIKDRIKVNARMVDDDKMIRMRSEDRFFGGVRVGLSFEKTANAYTILKFDFYSKYPSILKTISFFVTLVCCIIFIPVFFLSGFDLTTILFFLKFMLALPVLLALTFINEKVNRYATKKFMQHITRDFVE